MELGKKEIVLLSAFGLTACVPPGGFQTVQDRVTNCGQDTDNLGWGAAAGAALGGLAGQDIGSALKGGAGGAVVGGVYNAWKSKDGCTTPPQQQQQNNQYIHPDHQQHRVPPKNVQHPEHSR
ncbi:MAG: hypothetical protein WBK77_08185 [Alphaproteobacteria bacterium]